MTTFHPLKTTLPKPAKFTDPFHYEPHPLCLLAAREVQSHIEGDSRLRADADHDKMFGVLVVTDEDGRLGYLAAFSGLLAGTNNHEFFVPPVFDATRPDGYFKTHEAEITDVNRRIAGLLDSESYLKAVAERDACRRANADEEAAYRLAMAEAKARRDARRQSPQPVTPEEEAAMVRESQFQKAELRRIRQRAAERLTEAAEAADGIEAEVKALKEQRKGMSDDLQRWLFSQYSMLNARGESRSLVSIFAETPQRVPPAGAGDCCAPKLLQHAYKNRLRPVCMAEFWWGRSPEGEVRHHLHFYPACRGKCLPILGHMLQGLDVETGSAEGGVSQPLAIVYEDEWLAVVNKPAGMKSVPGRQSADSVAEEMSRRAPEGRKAIPVHRLDMDTSGLLVVAYGMDVYKELQAQFAARTVKKRYVALLDGTVNRPPRGEISIPLRPDPMDRPYQKVDYANGKAAVTGYQIVGTEGNVTRVALFPLTGRTHQLRLHCAHADGLGAPIIGDRLYGHGQGRLCLHAEAITFTHPVTKRKMTFERKAEFFQQTSSQ